MKKTLCKLSNAYFTCYLLQDEQNNLVISKELGDTDTKKSVVFDGTDDCEIKDIADFRKKFLTMNSFNSSGIMILMDGESFFNLKEFLEKGLKIPQHQMPNMPNSNNHQMHNIAPVHNPHNQYLFNYNQHHRSNQDNRCSSYGKINHNNQEEYNKYINRTLIRELVNSPERHILALKKNSHNNQI